MEHYIDVIAREIFVSNSDRAVAKNVNADTIIMTFDAEWSECTSKVAVFKNGGDEFRAAVDGDTVQIPWEVLDRPGILYLSVIGYVGEEKRIVTEKMARPYKVCEAGLLAGDKPTDPTPDAVQVLLSQAGTATNSANEAAARADAAQAAASAGEESRKAAEEARRAAEESRAAAESARASAEDSRSESEALRDSAEAARCSAEEARAASESKRVSAESSRAVAEAARVAEFDQMRQDFQGMQFILLPEGQYDPETAQPTIDGDTSAIYYVPNPRQTVGDLYLEWRYLKLSDGSFLWELIGGRDKLPDAITVADIDAAFAGTGTSKAERFLSLTGLAYMASVIKAGFAAIIHKHSASDIDSGVLPVERGGTGAGTALAAQHAILAPTEESASVGSGDPVFVLARPNGGTPSAGAVFKVAGSLIWNWLDSKIRETFGFDSNGRLSGSHIADKAVTADKLADGAVTGPKIADGSIGEGHLDEAMAASWESLSQVSFAGGATGVVFDNGTGAEGVQHPMIKIAYGGKAYGLMVNFADRFVYCIDFSDRSRDFTIRP